MSFSANGTTLATAESDGGTELWSFATQKQTGTALGSGRVSALAFNPDADVLATGDGNGTIELWDRPVFTSPPLRSPPARRNRRPRPAVTRRPCSAPRAVSSR